MFPFPFSFVAPTASGLADIDNVYSMEFDGINDYFNLGNGIPSLYQGAYSISYWVKQTSVSSQQYHFLVPYTNGSWVAPNYVDIAIFVDASGAMAFDVGGVWGYNRVSTASSSITTGDWQHICCTFDGTTNANGLKIYRNGVEIAASTSGISQTPGVNNSDIILGSRLGAYEFLDGDMDEVAIWNKALELADVQTIYNSTNDNPGKCANLFTGGLGSGLVYWNRMGD